MEYRAWNPFRSKLAAAILGGVDQIHIKPGCKVLYLGAASGTTVSHVSDIVGPVSGWACGVAASLSSGTRGPALPSPALSSASLRDSCSLDQLITEVAGACLPHAQTQGSGSQGTSP